MSTSTEPDVTEIVTQLNNLKVEGEGTQADPALHDHDNNPSPNPNAILLVKQTFSLFCLPPEIWVTICTFAAEQDTLTKAARRPREIHLNDCETLRQTLQQPAITRVCRSIRTEILPHVLHHSMGAVFVCLNHSQQVYDEVGAWLRGLSAEHRREVWRCALVVEPDLLERMKVRLREAWRVGFEVCKVDDERTVAFWESLRVWERQFLRRTVHAVRFV